MAEISNIFKGVFITDSLKNYSAIRNVSLCQFLFFLNIADIAQHIENNFYSDKDWHFRYGASAMIKFAVVKFFRQQPFKKIILSEDEAWLLGFKEKDGKILIPSGGTLQHFIKYRLGTEGITKIMEMVGERIIKLIDSKDAKLDSTPLEASRYDAHSDFNPHMNARWIKPILQ
jgi:hypothetical protein